jgi:hypothetical protein
MGQHKYSGKTGPSGALSTTDLTWADLGSDPCLCNERLPDSGEKSVSVPFFPSQISHGLTWDRTWASTVRDQQV